MEPLQEERETLLPQLGRSYYRADAGESSLAASTSAEPY